MRELFKKINRPKCVRIYEIFSLLSILFFICSEVYFSIYYPKHNLSIRHFGLNIESFIGNLFIVLLYSFINLYIVLMLTRYRNKISYFFFVGFNIYGFILFWRYIFTPDFGTILFSVFNLIIIFIGMSFLLLPDFMNWVFDKNKI